jgi:hypothetical protein
MVFDTMFLNAIHVNLKPICLHIILLSIHVVLLQEKLLEGDLIECIQASFWPTLTSELYTSSLVQRLSLCGCCSMAKSAFTGTEI